MRHLHFSGLVPATTATAAAALLGLTLVGTPASARLPDRDSRTTMPVPTTATVSPDQLGDDSVIAVVSRGRSAGLEAPVVAQSLEVITRGEGALSLIGTRGDELVISRVHDDCGNRGARSVLSLVDPVAKDETLLTVLRRTESWDEVIGAAEVRAWIW